MGICSVIDTMKNKKKKKSLNKIKACTQIIFTVCEYEIIATSLSFASTIICASVAHCTASFVNIYCNIQL